MCKKISFQTKLLIFIVTITIVLYNRERIRFSGYQLLLYQRVDLLLAQKIYYWLGGDISQEVFFDKALCEKRKDVAQFLLDSGVNINQRNPPCSATFLHGFLTIPGNFPGGSPNRREVGIVEWLLKKGADVHAKDSMGRTPLQYSMEEPNVSLDVVKLLIKAGAELEADYGHGLGLVGYAKMQGSVGLVEILLEAGAPDR